MNLINLPKILSSRSERKRHYWVMFEILLKVQSKCLKYHDKNAFLQTLNDQCDFVLVSQKIYFFAFLIVIKTGNIL